ncbi:recombinase family protein [Nocardiopsis sp. NPDC049922]|uniref:recombinase family protein n=1 Tax=Nocardiopsis sp. NPDC049922 TaxID=3155157 RepID=UPI0033F8E70D
MDKSAYDKYVSDALKVIEEHERASGEARGLRPAIGYLRASPGASAGMDALVDEAEREGFYVTEWVVDEGVSGSVSPWDRPGLAPWLGDNPPREFQALVFRIKSLVRMTNHMVEIREWADRTGRLLIGI